MLQKPRPTLKARAIAWLAQREYSRSELRLKLLRRARADLAAPSETAARAGDAAHAADPLPAVEQLLDALQEGGYLSESRFAASRIRARAPRHGSAQVRRELARHGVTLAPDAEAALRASELERARAVWSRKFGVAAGDAAGRARQARFLAGRGFSAEVIVRVVRGVDRGE